jgi:hypothetical protein
VLFRSRRIDLRRRQGAEKDDAKRLKMSIAIDFNGWARQVPESFDLGAAYGSGGCGPPSKTCQAI